MSVVYCFTSTAGGMFNRMTDWGNHEDATDYVASTDIIGSNTREPSPDVSEPWEKYLELRRAIECERREAWRWFLVDCRSVREYRAQRSQHTPRCHMHRRVIPWYGRSAPGQAPNNATV